MDDIDKSIHDKSLLNISARQMHSKNKNRSNNARLSGPMMDFNKVLNHIKKELIYKNQKSHNSYLTNSKKVVKETPRSIHFLSFLRNNKKFSENKKLNNQNNIILKNKNLNESNSSKKNNLFHTSFNKKYNRSFKSEINSKNNKTINDEIYEMNKKK